MKLLTQKVALMFPWLAVGAFLVFSSATLAGQKKFRETPVEECVLQTMDGWGQTKTSPIEPNSLPKRIVLIESGKTDNLNHFNIAVSGYRNALGPENLAYVRRTATRAAEGSLTEKESSEAISRLKEIRAPLKTLRFLYNATSEDHDAPAVLDELVTSLGKLRDVIRRPNPEKMKQLGKRMLAATEPERLGKIDRKIAQYQPSNRSDFKDWASRTLRSTRKILEKGAGTPDEFHQARKNLQALLAVYETEVAAHPGREQERKIAQFLLAETERMGDEVGEHEVQVIQEGLRYNKDVVEFPKDLSQELLAFLARFKLNHD